MTARDKEPPKPIEEMPFDEALARFLQTDPKELADAMSRVRQGQAEIERRANEVRENIRMGLRRRGRRPGSL
ncbi:MAG TPA: hypothetical protein VMU93_10110 [Caulobacteraceae bacterium]|nr:hypothetical protein [Caulobacteraceae bacterium]